MVVLIAIFLIYSMSRVSMGQYSGTGNLGNAATTKLDPTRFGFNVGFRIARDLDWRKE